MRVLEAATENLRREMHRGRGSAKPLPFPVALEPPFTPFQHSEIGRARGIPAGPPPVTKVDPVPISDLKFIRVRVSSKDTYTLDLAQQLLLASSSRHPVAFEAIASGGNLSFQLAVAGSDAPRLMGQIRSHYPGAQVTEDTDLIPQRGAHSLVARSYCLRDSHLFQIRIEPRLEPYIALAGVLSGLAKDEVGIFQVLFQQVGRPWRENILKVASDPWEPSKSAFDDLPDLPRKARSKVEAPLYAVAVRLAASTSGLGTRLQGSFLSQFEGVENGFVPIAPRYPVEAVLGRFTQTPGMLLNVRELAALVHLPNPNTVADGLETAQFSAAAPKMATEDILAPLGRNAHRGVETPVGISAEQLTRHLSILGGTGSGKTNLMKVAFTPLLDQGYGMAVLDPKGDLAQGFLDMVPEHRLEDVVWFDPADREFPPALNVLSSSADVANEDLTGELMLGLKRLFRGSSEFGPRMEWILRMAVRTLLESQGEKTLYDIPRFLEDASYRSAVLASVQDRSLRDFWQRRNLSRNVVDPILNRLSHLLDRPAIKAVVSQPNRIDFRQIMRERKIFIASLERGKLQDAAYILGSFILSRLQLAAMARTPGDRHLFPVLVDEFHNFAGHGMDIESIETFLSETRSYRVPLVVSTQYLDRLHRGVVAALFGNLGAQVCMNMGPIDAQVLQRELGRFSSEDLMNLGIGQAVIRMGTAKDTFNATVPLAEVRTSNRTAIIERSRERYCRPRAEVERLLDHDIETDIPEGRVWVADDQGNVFSGDRLEEYQAVTAGEGSNDAPPQQPRKPAGSSIGQAKRETEESPEDRPATGTAVHRELITYLEHVAAHPFTPVRERDRTLGLSKYRGQTLRQRLSELGWIRPHKVSTGRRSGQLVLLETTAAGHEFLASMRIRVERPQGRGGFLHKYYAYKLKEFSEANWPGCIAAIEDNSRGRPVDVAVRMPGETGRTLAFEIFMTGEAKEIRGIARDIELFDEVVVCAPDAGALESLRNRARESLGPDTLDKVTFSLVSQYLIPGESGQQGAISRSDSLKSSPKKRPAEPARSDNQGLKPQPSLEKSPARLELEPESPAAAPATRRRGRPPKTPLMDQVEQAFVHLHDLDWLQECDLAKLPEVLERIQPNQMMPEAQAIRGLLIAAARQMIDEMGSVPGKEGVAIFLERYLVGRSVSDIAQELGVSREWCSRNYRREALRLAGMQFVRSVSRRP